MADLILCEKEELTDVADAIREKTGETEEMQVSQMADKIRSIEASQEVIEAQEMTQAEHEALSEDEKNNGLYFITDGGMADTEMKKNLWNGEWSSGTIEVPNTNKYMLYAIRMSGQGTMVLAMRYGTHIRGIGGYSTATPSVLMYNFTATVSGNNWTFVACNYEHHTPSGNHGAITNCTVTSIIGII